MNIKYGSGHVQGFYSNDVVSIGGMNIPSMQFGEATVAMDNEHGTLFSGMQGEGILGLAFQGISEHSMPTIVDLLYESGQIPKRIFSFYLTRNVKRDGSVLILGGYNETYAREGFRYVPLVDNSFWAVSMSGLSAEGPNDSMKLCSGKSCIAIVDTGTSFLGVPNKKLPILLEFITRGRTCRAQKSKLMVCDCDKDMSGFPDLHIDLGGEVNEDGVVENVRLSLKPHDYLLQFYSDFRYQCAIGLQSVHSNLLGRDDDVYILGTTVLKTYYTVFDAEDLRVGFAYTKDEKVPINRTVSMYLLGYRIISLSFYISVLLFIIRLYQQSSKPSHPSSPSGSSTNISEEALVSYGKRMKGEGEEEEIEEERAFLDPHEATVIPPPSHYTKEYPPLGARDDDISRIASPL